MKKLNRNMKHLVSCLLVSGSLLGLSSMKSTAQTSGADIKLANLDLNRQAVSLTGDKKKEFPLAERGFLWDEDDAKTEKWRPQGITGLTEGGKEYVFVSWYGRKKEILNGATLEHLDEEKFEHLYEDRGARISVVELSSLKYRHILLVDKDKLPHEEMHAGGIHVLNGKLHVADDRAKFNVVRVYDINKIKELPENEAIKDYRHILIEEYNYKAPLSVDFMSYDNDKQKMLIGNFAEEPSGTKPNLLAWYEVPKNQKEATAFDADITKIPVYRIPDEYKKIQGIQASKAANGKTILWLSTSYGRRNRSNFYKMYIDINDNTPQKPTIVIPTNSSSSKYPPGLEDLFLSPTNELWLLTEFYFDEGQYRKLTGDSELNTEKTRRAVFCIKKEKILPKE